MFDKVYFDQIVFNGTAITYKSLDGALISAGALAKLIGK